MTAFFLKWLYKAFLLASLVQLLPAVMVSLWCTQAWEIIILQSNMIVLVLLPKGFLFPLISQLMSQIGNLNSITMFSCFEWIVTFCNKPKCFVLFNCLKKSDVLLCPKKIRSSFHKKDTGNINVSPPDCIPEACGQKHYSNICTLLKFFFHWI